MSRWMLTGGAGYIGSHVLRELVASGREVVVVDNLSTGFRERVPDGVPFVEASLTDHDRIVAALREYDVTGVIHLAAKKAVGESVERPLYYYRENVDGIVALLEAMTEAGVANMVYSSSAAVYGEPLVGEVAEDEQTVPTSPYGETKLVGEWTVRATAASQRLAGLGLSNVSLRYFNVAGAGSDDLGDTSVANLIPLVFRAITQGEAPKVFGTDYDTPDGSCIRDYIHVVDLARAHVAAVEMCEQDSQGELSAVFNVGRGEGSSVLEVIDVVSQVIGEPLVASETPRRAGDPAVLVAKTDRIETELGWRAQYDLTAMVASAWSAWPNTEAMRS